MRVRVMAMCKYRCIKMKWDALVEEGDGAEVEDGVGDVEEYQRRRGHNLLVQYIYRLGGVSDIRSHHREVDTHHYPVYSIKLITIRTKTRLLKVVMGRSGMKGASCWPSSG